MNLKNIILVQNHSNQIHNGLFYQNLLKMNLLQFLQAGIGLQRVLLLALKTKANAEVVGVFSTTGNIEGQWAIAGHPLTGLSEQQLVDCDHECMTYEGEQSCDAGCEGGLMPNAFKYVINNNGIGTEQEYPYAGIDQNCAKNYTDGAQISAWNMVPSNETQMAAYLVNVGPLSIAVDAELWQFYFGGVFDFPWCGTTLDHGVLIVGYGTATDWLGQSVDFWNVKNSWGSDWGQSGYIQVERNENECGVDLFPCTSTIKS